MQPTLAYVEQDALFKRIETGQAANYTCHIPGVETKVKTFICPSDPNGGKNLTAGATSPTPNPSQGFHGNYVACSGNEIFGSAGGGNNLKGIFFPLSTKGIAAVTDGTTNTLMLSEILLAPDTGAHDLRGRYHNTWEGNTLFSALNPPNTTVGDVSSYCVAAPGAPCGPLSGANVVQYARSRHTGGVNVGLADGSVRFVRNGVDPQAWRDAATCAGGETPGNF